MNEDFGLDVWMEDQLNGGYGYILDDMASDFFNSEDDYYEEVSQWDDDPSPYDGDYSEE